MNQKFIVGVVGNPNCGKTTLFNALTGSKQHVGNWPGVTVEQKTGEYNFNSNTIELVDLPGTYSLESTDDSVSLDEKIARDYVASKQADLIINILDASNIERNLYLTSQLIEMRVPMILVLNMMDVVKQRGLKIDEKILTETLGFPVISVTASYKKGIKELKTLINSVTDFKTTPTLNIPYPPLLEDAIEATQTLLNQDGRVYSCDLRWLGIRALEQDTLAISLIEPQTYNVIQNMQEQVEDDSEDEIDILAADARYSFVNTLTQKSLCKLNEVSRHHSEIIDNIVLNRFLGIPIFLLVMYFMFLFTINIGSAFIDVFDQLVGAIAVDGLGVVLSDTSLPEWLIILVTQGVGGGIQVVATFIPIVGFLFLFLSALEDSGYMSRAA
ncbi:MAG: ferrous iron transport protein B, partial [Methylococcales bacterium]|nr:ferrous iron transport protein B [Methylococcales bacterium]